MALDADRALDLLVEQRHVIPAASVVAQLKAVPPAPTHQERGVEAPDPKYFLHRYLAALFERDPTEGGDYHALMVRANTWLQRILIDGMVDIVFMFYLLYTC
eukprot:1906610-Pyramimonas_sp.AAC.1